MSHKNGLEFRRALLVCVVLALSCLVFAEKDKNAPGKSDVTGHYEGTAKNNAGEVITVALDLTTKDGTISGTIKSSHGDFAVTGGSQKGADVTLEFEANGTAGTITLKRKEDGLVGTWSAGDDGGPLEVKKAAAPVGDSKGKL